MKPRTWFCANRSWFCGGQRRSDLAGQIAQFDCSVCTGEEADAARADFALIESNLEYIASQLAQRPTRGDLAKTALGIIFCSAILTTLFVWIAWH